MYIQTGQAEHDNGYSLVESTTKHCANQVFNTLLIGDHASVVILFTR